MLPVVLATTHTLTTWAYYIFSSLAVKGLKLFFIPISPIMLKHISAGICLHTNHRANMVYNLNCRIEFERQTSQGHRQLLTL